MSAKLYYSPFIPAFSSNGAPVPGARLNFYLTGTSTRTPIYSDAALTIEHTNPVIANASGRYPDIYLDENITYRVVQTDSLGAPLGDAIDPYIPGRALKGDTGEPGGNVESIGLFTAADGMAIPASTSSVRTSGHTVDGIGAARYIADASVDAAYITAQPLSSFAAADGRGFRIDVSDGVSIAQLGALPDDETATAANEAAWAEALLISKVLHVPVGTFHLENSVDMADNVIVKGAGETRSILQRDASGAVIYARRGITEPFTEFLRNVAVMDLGFTRADPDGPNAINFTNVRGLRVERCAATNRGLLTVDHAGSVNGLITAAMPSGSPTVDPAIVAGFDATGDDLNEDIVCVDCACNPNVFFGSGIRVQYARNGELSRNRLTNCKISWWGGGAPVSEGGALSMLRRFRNFRISDNEIRFANGCIYGNNGDGIVVVGNYCEGASDTAIDFEGCFNCIATGNVVRDAGNYCTSIFYASVNNRFSDNVLIQTMGGRDVAVSRDNIGFTQNKAIDSIVAGAGTSGRVRITFATAHPIVGDQDTGQLVRIDGVSGTLGDALNGQAWRALRVADTVIDLINTSTFAALSGSGGSVRYSRGQIFFAANTAGFSVSDNADDVSFEGNECWYETPFALGYISSSDDVRTFRMANNRLRNVRVTTANNSPRNLIEGNLFDFTQPSLSAEYMVYSTGTIRNNTLKVLGTTMPAGSAGFVGYISSTTTANCTMEGNHVREEAGGSLPIHMGMVANRGSQLHRFLIQRNRVDEITDLSTQKGSLLAWYEGNRTADGGLPVPASTTFSGSTSTLAIGGVTDGCEILRADAASGSYRADCAVQNSWSTNNAWTASATYAAETVVYNGSNVYVATTGGTAAGSGGPTGTGSAITDGTVTWRYIAPRTAWKTTQPIGV